MLLKSRDGPPGYQNCQTMWREDVASSDVQVFMPIAERYAGKPNLQAGESASRVGARRPALQIRTLCTQATATNYYHSHCKHY